MQTSKICNKVLTIEEISDLVHVDFKIGYLNMELQIFFHTIDVIKNIINDSGNNTLFVWIPDNTFHRMCFSCLHMFLTITYQQLFYG